MASLLAKSAVSAKIAAKSRQSVVSKANAGAGRTLWLPDTKPPKHLDGSLPGDFGFDPLGLGQNPDRLKWYVEGERTNGRWAMIAVAGILGQELLGVQPKWFLAGGEKEYDIPVLAQLPILFLVMGFLETKRFQGFKETGTSGFINSFPFDPAGMNSKDMQVKEVKNGRLAMIAFIGFCVQALVSRTGPIEGLQAHLGNPFGRNITYYLTHLPETLAGAQ